MVSDARIRELAENAYWSNPMSQQQQIIAISSAIRQALAEQREEDAKVARFGALCFAEHRDEMADLDGGWLQDKAEECGLLERLEITKELLANCDSGFCDCGDLDYCYWPTAAGEEALAAAIRAQEGKNG